jgi:hypothetical protein
MLLDILAVRAVRLAVLGLREVGDCDDREGRGRNVEEASQPVRVP